MTGALRRDASSKFSATETNQIYPKLSGSFVVSDLNFWKASTIGESFNSLKLRASYGESGNLSGIGSYSRFWQFQPIPFLGRNTIIPSSTLANPAVRPERMAKLEFGADMSFLKDRLTLTVTAYSQQIKDLVVNRTLAPSTGGTGIVNNVGTMEKKGIELMLGATPVKTKDFSWDVTAIFNRNRNKILSLGSPRIEISTVSGAPVFLIEGQPASVFFEFRYARNADGSLLLTPQGFPQRERGTQGTGNAAFGLAATLVPNATDRRLAFYLRANPTATQNLGSGFYAANTAPVPVYLPGEMLLIRAEAYARKNDLANATTELNKVLTKTPADDAWGVGAALPVYSGAQTSAAILNEIYRNRQIELAFTGLRLEDSRRFGRPGPGTTPQANAERTRNFLPYPFNERDNNSATPQDPAN